MESIRLNQETSELKKLIRRNMNAAFLLSIIVLFLVGLACYVGLFLPYRTYAQSVVFNDFHGNDLVTFLFACPVLLLSMAYTYQNRLIGLLCWQGALFYMVYTYISYLVALSIGGFTYISYLLIVVSSGLAIYFIQRTIQALKVKQEPGEGKTEKLAGIILAVTGMLFFLRAVGQLVMVVQGVGLSRLDVGLLVADYLVSPLWVMAGLSLAQQRPFGFRIGVSLFFQAAMLLVGLTLVLAIRPLLSPIPFVFLDFLAIFVMAVVFVVVFSYLIVGSTPKKRIVNRKSLNADQRR